MFYPEGWSESERERERSPEQADRKSRAREAREDFIYAIGDINAEWGVDGCVKAQVFGEQPW